DVDRDRVAILHGGDRTAVEGLGRDMPGHEPMRGAGEAPVSEQRDVLAQPDAVQGRRDREHLAHAGPAGRALVADDDDVAGGDALVRDGLHRRLLALEDPGGPTVVPALVAGELPDAA